MRIAISGSQCTGKSTLIRDMLASWPMYKQPSKTYRDIIIESGALHSSKTTQDTQLVIRDWMVKEIGKAKKSDNIIFDRCLLDNVIYSMWAYGRSGEPLDKEFIDESLTLCRESMRKLDFIFYIPSDRDNIDIEDDLLRDTDPVFRQEIDEMFRYVLNVWKTKPDSSKLFP